MIIRAKKGNEELFELYKETGNQSYLDLYENGFTFAREGERTQCIIETLQTRGVGVFGKATKYLQR